MTCMAVGSRERLEEDEEWAPRSIKRSGPYSNYSDVKQNRKRQKRNATNTLSNASNLVN